MASQLTITIGAGQRGISTAGRLFAGETATVTITGMASAAASLRLALVSPTRQTLAACVSFAASGQDAAGDMTLATEELRGFLSDVPTGRMVAVAVVVFADGGDVYGGGFAPVVAAPFTDEIQPVPPVVEYVTEAQMEAAITAAVAPKLDKADVVAPSPDASSAGKAADAMATGNALNALNVAVGQRLTASDLGNLSVDITTGGTVSAGAMNIQGEAVATQNFARGLSRYDIEDAEISAGSVSVADRAVTSLNASADFAIVAPAETTDKARDFVVIVNAAAALTITATEDAEGYGITLYSDDADVLTLDAAGLYAIAFTEFSAPADFIVSKKKLEVL